jgi:hypothetical protein
VGARGPDLPNSLSSKRWPRRSELNARRLRRASQNDTFEDRVRVSHTAGTGAFATARRGVVYGVQLKNWATPAASKWTRIGLAEAPFASFSQ